MWDKIIKGCAIFLTILGVFSICIYYYLNYKTVKDSHITGAFIGNQIDPQTGEERPLLEVNVYSNGNGKGKKVVEFRLNALSDVEGQTMYSVGAQLVDNNIYFYDTHNGIDWPRAGTIKTASVNLQGGNEYGKTKVKNPSYEVDITNATKFPVKLAGEDNGFALVFSGIRVDRYRESNFLKGVLTGMGLCIPLLIGGMDAITDQITEVKPYSIADFLSYCETLASGKSTGYGDTYIDAIDLSKFFGLYQLGADGKYHDVETYSKTGESKYYFSANVHYDYRGMQLASQSMFGAVANDNQYNITGIDSLEYWRTDVNYLLTNKDLDLSYDNENNGYWVSLRDETLRKINNQTASIICDLVIDLDDFDGKKILGADYYGLSGVNYKSIQIKSLINTTFEMREFATYGAEIGEISGQRVTIINAGGEG